MTNGIQNKDHLKDGKETIDVFKRAIRGRVGTGERERESERERERRARRQTDQETICVDSDIGQQAFHRTRQEIKWKARQGKARQGQGKGKGKGKGKARARQGQGQGKARASKARQSKDKTIEDLECSSLISTFEMEGSTTNSCDGFEDEDTEFEVKERGFEREEIGSADDFSLAIMTRYRRIIFRWSRFAPFLTSGSQANMKRRWEKRQNTRQKKPSRPRSISRQMTKIGQRQDQHTSKTKTIQTQHQRPRQKAKTKGEGKTR
jgi:hypothetical protein